jgi:hypothetical protein
MEGDMFDPFKMWDEMLDIYNETVRGSKDETVYEMIDMEVTIPAVLEEEFIAMVDKWLEEKGFGCQ